MLRLIPNFSPIFALDQPSDERAGEPQPNPAPDTPFLLEPDMRLEGSSTTALAPGNRAEFDRPEMLSIHPTSTPQQILIQVSGEVWRYRNRGWPEDVPRPTFAGRWKERRR